MVILNAASKQVAVQKISKWWRNRPNHLFAALRVYTSSYSVANNCLRASGERRNTSDSSFKRRIHSKIQDGPRSRGWVRGTLPPMYRCMPAGEEGWAGLPVTRSPPPQHHIKSTDPIKPLHVATGIVFIEGVKRLNRWGQQELSALAVLTEATVGI